MPSGARGVPFGEMYLGDADNATGTREVDCRYMCPSLMLTPDAWPLWILVSAYLSVALLALALLIKGGTLRVASFRVRSDPRVLL